jgi:hypothetical protein
MTSTTTTWAGPSVARPVRFAGSRPRPTRARLRLTRRGRLVLVLLAVTVALLAVRVGGAVAGAPGEPVEVRVHVVTAGETLWGHAQRLAGPGEDVRDVVARIVELNGLSSSGLAAGQRLLLPVDA